jgi:catalase
MTDKPRDGLEPAEAIDRIEAAMHPRVQDRRLHSRGTVYEAHFVPSGKIDHLTVATHLRNPTPAVVRFSNGGPNNKPPFDADDREPGVRGMAVKFLVDGRAEADLAAASSPTFPTRNPEAFVALIELSGMRRDGIRGKLRMGPKLVSMALKHPETLKAVREGQRPAPASYAAVAYHGIHAFFLVDADGQRHRFRYTLRPTGLPPEKNEIPLDGDKVPDFLAKDLDDQLTKGPVEFTLWFQLGKDGDPTDDPTKAWPKERDVLKAGKIIITERSADEDNWQSEIFDPTNVPAGVELSDDPILAFRRLAYKESAKRRHQHTSPGVAPG